ncbi:GNAT family N-acetyltransferase [Kineococcus glutinatus]|uniref:GNAT family N-acetyltransferase n=1 Tax=Kineococcus glutinatus TaxID=1070872 RepID=A0ABP9HSZ2_9ACTN
MIRLARPQDLPRLRDVERAAGEPFRDLGMDAVADDEPPTTAELAAHRARGRAWVATDEQDVPVGYLLLDVVDGAAHVEQVSVHPAWARRRLGGRLLEAADGWAAEHGLTAVTLTTFADVPWNAPWYARLGFAVVPDEEAGPGLLAVRRHERERGLEAWPRVSMRRPVAGPA